MLIEQTIEKMNAMKMFGMRDALSEQTEGASYASLSFEERVGMLIDREWIDRENRKLTRRMKAAKLKIDASMEGMDYRTSRGLDPALLRSLSDCRWVKSHSAILIVGPTGTGKTFISCALADAVLRKGHTARYYRAPRLFSDLLIAKADGSYPRFLARLAKTHLLAIDDFGLAPLTDLESRELLEVIEDRNGSGSTIIASQLPVSAWHELIGEPTIADAILDRIVHNSYRIELSGPSMRKRKAKEQKKEKGAED